MRSRTPQAAPERFKLTTKYILVLLGLVFVLSMSIFTLMTILRTNTEDESTMVAPPEAQEDGTAATVLRLLLTATTNAEQQNFNNDAQKNATTQVHVDVESAEQEMVTRLVRDTSNATTQRATVAGAGYYEEQRPVVVHAESLLPVMGVRQRDYGAPPAQAAQYYGASALDDNTDDDGDDDDDDASLESEQGYEQQQRGYYDDEQAEGEQLDADGLGDVGYNYAGESVGEGRAAGGRASDAYYRQWYYATPAPASAPANRQEQSSWQLAGQEVGANRKLQPAQSDPYAAYDSIGPVDDYEYPGGPSPPQNAQRRPTTIQQQQKQQQHQQLQPQQRRPTQAAATEAATGALQSTRPTESTENTLISTLKNLKTMWDIYQAFAAAWNVVALQRQKQYPQQQQQQQQQQMLKRKQQQKQQQQQQQSRINSRKPPKFDNGATGDKFAQRNKTGAAGGSGVARIKPSRGTKNPITTKTTPKTTTTSTSSDDAESDIVTAKVEPREWSSTTTPPTSKGDGETRDAAQGVREKRQISDADDKKSTDVGEGRYIKGDPLKGYYDFVITEGSYKFWAAFQTGTALLIIYSTFAAIYYSKVNPLVSDYDYTDYLGGARSLSGGDLDFVDDADAGKDDNDAASAGSSNKSGRQQRRRHWYERLLPRAERTMKQIFEALDRLPVDHRAADELVKQRQQQLATDAQHTTTTTASIEAAQTVDEAENAAAEQLDDDATGDVLFK